MKSLKKNIKFIIVIIVGMILVSSISVWATYNYLGSDVSYMKVNGTKLSVQDALDELYKNTTNNANNSLVLYDKSGNNYNAILINGTCIKSNTDGTRYIYFDGTDDYVELPELSADIDWNDGFTIETQLELNNLDNNTFSRIICCNNGPNIIRYGRQIYFTSSSTGDIRTINNVNLNEKFKFKLNVIKKAENSYEYNFYKNDNLYYSTTLTRGIPNVENKMYISGNKGWSGDICISGKIYYLSIEQSDGTQILEYKF